MYKEWFEENYHEMSDYGLWFRGDGFNLVQPDEWDVRRYRVLIVRLSTARDTEDSFTHQLLYQTAAGCEGIFPDCAWLPPPEDASLFDAEGIPWCTGVVTKRPAREFDCIAVSNSVLLELVNLPSMLTHSGISLSGNERMADASAPVVILGGANALFASILLSDAPPVDAIFTGDDIESVRAIFMTGRDCKVSEEGKNVLLEKLSAVEGIILPEKPQTTVKKAVPLQSKWLLRKAPVFSGQKNYGSAALQISEGCRCFCTFCAESWSRKPYRELAAEECVDAALAMKTEMGLHGVELYSFNFNMYSRLRYLLSVLGEQFSSIGLKSQRLDGIADDPALMKLLHAYGKSSITVGIEGISSRLRARLQKSLSDTKLHTGLSRILQTPLRELKLFFLATGWENEADFQEFRALLQFLGESMRTFNRYPRIIISVTPLVRFPFTPLENDPSPEPATLREIILQCERIVQARRYEFRVAASMNEYLVSQFIARPGGAGGWRALEAAVAETGFVYYDDISDWFVNAFSDALLTHRLSLTEKKEGCSLRLPVTLPVRTGFIAATSEAAETYTDRGYCSTASDCIGCGACDGEKIRNSGELPLRQLPLPQKKGVSGTIDLQVACVLGPSLRGLPRSLVAADLARRIMKSGAVPPEFYRGDAGTLVADRCESDWIHGDEIITLRFSGDAVGALSRMCGDGLLTDAINAQQGLALRVGRMSVGGAGPGKLSLTILSPWKCDPSRYCSAASLRYCLERDGENGKRFVMTKDALKKKNVLSLDVKNESGLYEVKIVPGVKFSFRKFLRSTVELPSVKHEVRISTEARFTEGV